jgi:AcrR family transcriptional regulator
MACSCVGICTMGKGVYIVHSVSHSATRPRQAATGRAITRTARRLTAEHGLDGFTMHQLAQDVGVSRRTLFNYVPGKLDAVLGSPSELDPELIEAFKAGGPSGHLLTDVKELVRAALETDDVNATDVDDLRRLLRADARLLHAVHERFVDMTTQFSAMIADREGDQASPLTGRLVATMTLNVLDVALDEGLADTTITLADHYVRVFDAAAALFGEQPA